MVATAYDYQKLTDNLIYSRDNFAQVDVLLGDANNPSLTTLRQRWLEILNQGVTLAEWVRTHHRAQSAEVYQALSELAKYTDVRRPFRLSIIGQKGVGKSALVNALLATPGSFQYTPSDVTGKALSGTRIRLMAQTTEVDALPESQPTWKVVFLTPRRLWEIGSFLLTVARLPLPRPPVNLDDPTAVLTVLQNKLTKSTTSSTTNTPHTPNQIQMESARQTLTDILQVYTAQHSTLPTNYTLVLADPDVEGPVSVYIKQTEQKLHLIVDWVERRVPQAEAGWLAGRPLELEDVLGLDDPRDSFYALEAFKEAFAVVMVFKCDRGLNTETSSILKSLFSRSEEELAQFGEISDLEKALIVANRFDEVVANVAADGSGTANPLKGIDDITTELAAYTRQASQIPIFLTSASLALTTQLILNSRNGNQKSDTNPTGIPGITAGYSSYLLGLNNLLELTTAQAARQAKPLPEYLEFIQSKRSAIETAQAEPLQAKARAELTLELTGLPRLSLKIEEALESGSILRGRVGNAEFYYAKLVSESAACYAQQLLSYKLDIGDFSHPPISQESRLFSRFQHENRLLLEKLDQEFRNEWFGLAQRYIYGPHSAELTSVKTTFLETVQQVIWQNQKLIQIEQHIASGQLVTDAWRKVFEDINDWLALEAGRQMRLLVGPLLAEIERVVDELQKQLSQKITMPLAEVFWQNYRSRLDTLRERLQQQAEILALGFYTDNRFSVYDETIARILHVGDETQRRTEISQALQDRVRRWFNNLWQLVAKVAMTDLNAFVNEVRYYVLGLPAENSLLVGLELRQPGSSQLAPSDSLLELLKHHYYTDQEFRRQYAQREPAPAERVSLEIRGWLELLQPPIIAFSELNQALVKVQTRLRLNEIAESGAVSASSEFNQPSDEAVQEPTQASWPPPPLVTPTTAVIPATTTPSETNSGVASYNRLQLPIQSFHPYNPVTRQVWEISLPNPTATTIRLHFSRIDLGTAEAEQARIVIEAWGGAKTLTITGQHSDYWTEMLPARAVKIRFITNQSQPCWGFLVDAVSE